MGSKDPSKTSRKCTFYDKKNTSIATPDDLFEALDEEYDFNFDPCPFDPSPKQNGLTIPWGTSNFVNPPYDDVGPWIDKAINEMLNHGHKSVLLIPFRANTNYFTEKIFNYCTNIYLFAKRIKFKGYNQACPLLISLIVFDPTKLMQGKKSIMTSAGIPGLPIKQFGDYTTFVIK